MFNLAKYKLYNDEYMSCAWPGMYPIYYICADNEVLCPACVNENKTIIESEQVCGSDKQWLIVDVQINYEDSTLTCSHCYKVIESAYGENNE